MKKQLILFAIICLALPIILRGLWFYQGLFIRFPSIQAPDYGNFQVPQPVLSTQPFVNAQTSSQRVSVLFDMAHTNRFGLAEIDTLTKTLLLMGASVQSDKDGKDLPSKLQNADSYVVIAPTIVFSKENIQSIKEFVSRGGHLLIVADPTRTYQNFYFDMEDSVLIANQILEPYRIAYQTDYVYSITHNEGNFRNIYVVPTAENSLTKKLSEMVFYGSHSISGNLISLLKGDETTLSSGTDNGGDLKVAALSNNGNVLVLGDMGFIVTPYNQVADNYQLILNIAEWLAGNARVRTIADFPDLFTRPLVVMQNQDVDFDKNLMVEISTLQSIYQTRNIPVSIAEQPQTGKDLLIMGIYPPSKDLKPYLETFNINFNASFSATPFAVSTPTPTIINENISTATIEAILPQIYSPQSSNYFSIPGLGLIPSKGFNIILFVQQNDRNTLILLSESKKNLIELLKLVNKGTLKDCLIQTQIAVCPGGSVTKDVTTPTATTVTTPTPTFAVNKTATPVG
jgi:hypothetical protein